MQVNNTGAPAEEVPPEGPAETQQGPAEEAPPAGPAGQQQGPVEGTQPAGPAELPPPQ